MTYRELLTALEAVPDARLDTEVCGFDDECFVFWANGVEIDGEGWPTLQGTDDV